MNALNPEKRCRICGEWYKPFALTGYEANIKDADHVCNECLELLVAEKYPEVAEKYPDV